MNGERPNRIHRGPSWARLPCLSAIMVQAALVVGLLAFGASVLFGQQTQTVCGIKYPVNTAPLVDTVGKRTVTDSIPCLRTSGGSAVTQLRNRLYLRDDSLRRRPIRVDTILVPVLVVDTVYLPASDSVIPLPPEDSVPDVPPDPPPAGEQFTDTLSGVRDGDVVCADGHTCLVGALEIRRGSLRTVNGTIAFRDGSRLHLTGGSPDEYVGGGMYWTPDLGRTDFGVWIGGATATGRLDVACSPVTAWNRTGEASDWKASDVLWSAPVLPGDFEAHRYTLGQPVPRADPLVPPTEIVNVTRGCSISGTGHVHIHSGAPQSIQNILLDSLGISNRASGGPALGRYVLHLHMNGDASRGTIIRGVVATNSRGKVFVPHASHGVTMLDNASVNSFAECLWWDFGEGHETNDILVDRLACVGVQMPDSVSGQQSNVPGISLASGVNMEIRNSAVSGVRGGPFATGFDWPEPTAIFGSNPKLVWIFNQGNVAHNNRAAGLRFWTNLGDAHVNSNFVTYRNSITGVENGAYFVGTEYHNCLMFEDGYQVGNGEQEMTAFLQNGNATTNTAGRPGQLTDCTLASRSGPALRVGHRQLPATVPFLIERVVFKPGPGHTKIEVATPDDNPWIADIVSSDVRSADISFWAPIRDGTLIRIDNDGDGIFECRVWTEGGQKRASGC